MQTHKKTIEVVDNFTIKACLVTWSIEQDGYDCPECYATFKDLDTFEEFSLPVNKEFLNQVQTNQTIEMEIRFL